MGAKLNSDTKDLEIFMPEYTKKMDILREKSKNLVDIKCEL
jgi:hypothetical protein